MRWALAVCVMLSLSGAAAAATKPSMTIVEPRPFGYFLGDTLRREVEIRVGPGEQLDLASLPRPGPLNYWLELSSAEVEKRNAGEETVYRFLLTYQTFYAPLDPRRLEIPGFKLEIKGGTGGEVSVPAFSFLTSPIRQLFTEKGDTSASATALRPDRLTPRQPTGLERTALLVAGAAAAGALIVLCWHNAWWPFDRRPARPFTEVARFIRSNWARLGDERGYRAALIRMHRAFDQSAGQRVLADDIGGYLDRHPEFAPYAADVERLFSASRRAFFGNDLEEAHAAMPLTALADLSARLSVAERRAG